MQNQFTAIVLLATICSCSGNQVIKSADKATQDVGYYALPRALIQAKITATYPAICTKAPVSKEAPAADDFTGDTSSLPVTCADDIRKMTSKETEIKIELTKKFIPDRIISLHYDPDVFSHDKLTVDVDSNGLLEKVSIDVKDRTGEFIVKLAELVKEGAKASVSLGSPASTVKFENNKVTREITVFVDPLEPGNYAYFGGLAILNVTGFETIGTSDVPATECTNEICYPMLVPRKLSLSAGKSLIEERVVIVPDPRRLVKIDLKRASFVQKTLTATFENGLLTKLDLDKPSEALSFIQVPIDVLKAIASIPAELIQLKIDTSKNNAALADQRVKELEAQQKLLEALIKAREANKGNNDAPNK